MKTFFKPSYIASAIIMAALSLGSAEQADATKEIESTLRDYLAAMAARDTDGLLSVVDQRLAVIEADRTNAKIGFLDTHNGKELFPPEGNDDWNKDKIRLSSVKVEVSATHPSVAIASLTLTFPLTDKRVAVIEAALKQMPADFNERERKAAQKMVTDRAIHNSMFAMLARKGGKWKIVCLSLPK